MATSKNPAGTTGTTVESADAAAPANTVSIRWKGATKLKGVRQRREIGGTVWTYDGWSDAPVADIDRAVWDALTPAQRKADGLEEVS